MTKQELSNPIFRYVGSKFSIRNFILETLDQYEHQCFVDVFCGTGVISFNKKPAKTNVINDINEDVYNFFLVLHDKESFQKFMEYYKTFPVSRDIFRFMRKRWLHDTDKIKRAFAFFYVQTFAFGGSGHGSFACSFAQAKKILTNYIKKQSKIKCFCSFIQKHFVIENMSFETLIPKFDSEQTLFYCDPPYVINTRGTKQKEYANEMTDDDHRKLVELLLKIKGHAVLSAYETDIYNPLLDHGWKIKRIQTKTLIRKTYNCSDMNRIECLYYSPNINKQTTFFRRTI